MYRVVSLSKEYDLNMFLTNKMSLFSVHSIKLTYKQPFSLISVITLNRCNQR